MTEPTLLILAPPLARRRPGARRATVIGAGSFGTALAVLLAGVACARRCRRARREQAQALEAERENRLYLPGVELPGQLRIEPASAGVARADYVFLAVPSQALGRGDRGAAGRGPGPAHGGGVGRQGPRPAAGAPPTSS